jgi:ribosome-associated protein
MTADQLVETIVDLADAKQADNIVTLNIAKKSSLTDYFVICEGNSDVHLRTIAGYIVDELKKRDIAPVHREKGDTREWIVLDYGDVIVHIFRPDVRKHYALEELWGKSGVGKNP